MKVVCPACERIAAAASYREEDGTLWLRCTRCGAESALVVEAPERPTGPLRTAPAPLPEPPEPPAPSRVLPLRPVAVSDAVRLAADAAASADPFAVPEDRCPKCIAERPAAATTCPHCGLAYVNFDAQDALPSPELSEAFLTAMRAWDDTALHDRVLMLATQRAELAQVGRLYRLRLAAAPLDPVAQRGRDEVLRRASAASEVLRANAAATERRAPLWQYVAFGIVGVFFISVLVVFLRRLFG